MTHVLTLADVRAELSRSRVSVKRFADAMGMSYARCSTLLNGDPLVDLTEEGAKRVSVALEAVRREEAAV